MQFNSEINNDDIVSDITFWTDADLSSGYILADRTRSCNRALDVITAAILKADGLWQSDDTNNSGELFDISTTLVSGTSKYSIPITWLKISRIRVKGPDGVYITLTPKDRRKMEDFQINADAGSPKTYDRLGNYLYIYPKPNYGATAGIEVQFQRGPSYFIATDTTKAPGFAAHFHRLVPLMASLDYTEVNDLNSRSEKIRARINAMMADLQIHYADRNTDEQAHMSLSKEDYGASTLV